MNSRLEYLIDFIERRWGLTNYTLHKHTVLQEVNAVNETKYVLCTEWLPKGVDGVTEDDVYPEGAATIELDIHEQTFARVNFTGGISFSDQSYSFSHQTEVIKWVEALTGLIYRKSFMRERKKEQSYTFKSCIDEIPTYPGGLIQVEWNEQNQLTLFSKQGVFVGRAITKEEMDLLQVEDVYDLFEHQVDRYAIPNFEQQVINEVYMIEELFVRHDLKKTYPYSLLERPYVQMNKPLIWMKAGERKMVRTEFSMSREVSIKTAIENEESIDAQPITKDIQLRVMEVVAEYVSSFYPNDSGKWMFSLMYREWGLLQAVVRPFENREKGFRAKLVFMIDPRDFEVLNILDTSDFAMMYESFKKLGDLKIHKEEAVHALWKHMTLEPYYVYDEEEEHFVFCGKLDCKKVILANSGTVLDEKDL
ncbi:hypothetical protein [Alkalicoccobacillus gibsonii]|uniref:hypothetical protein n=1 Tax=Alkalicoccobacillus gibsonii TaxID=79881 RepID=UPI0019325C52|nr:hypothetical protein [Alkalicoccobacillus gibsonii]MBM0065519.1 hypothetical protein [Alkalicoccobacillus gibsonii]